MADREKNHFFTDFYNIQFTQQGIEVWFHPLKGIMRLEKDTCHWDGSGICADANCHDFHGPQGLEVYFETYGAGNHGNCWGVCAIIGRPTCKKSLCCKGLPQVKGKSIYVEQKLYKINQL